MSTHTYVKLRSVEIELWSTSRGHLATASEAQPAPTVWLYPGEEYHILVRNKEKCFAAETHPEFQKWRVAAVVAPDGKNSLEPTQRASLDSRPWVINPNSQFFVKGWQIATGENGVVRPFVITEFEDSVVANTEDSDIFAVGKITVAFIAEARANLLPQYEGYTKGGPTRSGTLSSSPSHATGAGQPQQNKTKAVKGFINPTYIGWLMFAYKVIGGRPASPQGLTTPPGFADPLGNVPIAGSRR